MTSPLIRDVCNEKADPRQALTAYAQWQRASRAFSAEILVAAIVCPVLAVDIAWEIQFLFNAHRSLGITLVLALLGYLPPLLIFERRYLDPFFVEIGFHREYRRGEAKFNRLLFRVFGVTQIWVKDLFQLFCIFAIVLIILLPFTGLFILIFGDITSAPRWPGHLILILATVFATAFMFSKARMPLLPIRGYLAGMLVDLRLGASAILQMVAGLAVSGVLTTSSGLLGPLFTRKVDLLVATGATGLLFGVSMAFWERDCLLANLCRIGQARCRLRLGVRSWRQRAEARYLLLDVLDTHPTYCPGSITAMANALVSLERHDPAAAREELAAISPALPDQPDSYGPHQALWDMSITATLDAVGQPAAPVTSAGTTEVESARRQGWGSFACPSFGRGVLVVGIAVVGFALMWAVVNVLASLVRGSYHLDGFEMPGETEQIRSLWTGMFALNLAAIGLCYGSYNLILVVNDLAHCRRQLARRAIEGLVLRVLGFGLIVQPLTHLFMTLLPVVFIMTAVELVTHRGLHRTLIQLLGAQGCLFASAVGAWYLLWRWAREPTFTVPPLFPFPFDLWDYVPDRWWPGLIWLILIAVIVTLILADIAI